MGFRGRTHEKSQAQGRYEVLVLWKGLRRGRGFQKAWMVVDCWRMGASYRILPTLLPEKAGAPLPPLGAILLALRLQRSPTGNILGKHGRYVAYRIESY